MKNIFRGAVLTAFIIIAPTAQSRSTDKLARNHAAVAMSPAEVQQLIDRLDEIKAMDRGSMTKKERLALRKEVKASQKAMNSGGGLYISVGALIIIILLLIILL